mmetsp:Transcript_92126/g.260270  ORF Transcript_92126/g.260270 Transcript_92126/m.260270 type:complete len:201 (-) Transcript_92126:429-1031(-)
MHSWRWSLGIQSLFSSCRVVHLPRFLGFLHGACILNDYRLRCSLHTERNVLRHGIEPTYPAAGRPFTAALLAALVVKDSGAMLLAVLPRAHIAAGVGPDECACPVLFAFHVLPLVDLPVWPGHSPMAMELVPLPLPCVRTAIAPIVSALAMEHVLLKLSAELRARCPMQRSKAGLHTFVEAAPVPTRVMESLNALAMRGV